MGTLIIQRNSEWNNKGRNIGIYKGGEKVGAIGDGEVSNLDLEPGCHRITAKIDWCRSKTLLVEVEEGGNKTIRLSGFKYGNIISPLILGLLLLYYLLTYALDLDVSFILIIAVIGFLYPVYYITFGRKNYLRLTEVK